MLRAACPDLRSSSVCSIWRGPDAVAITPDWKTAYVANGGEPSAASDTVTPIRTKMVVMAWMPTGGGSVIVCWRPK